MRNELFKPKTVIIAVLVALALLILGITAAVAGEIGDKRMMKLPTITYGAIGASNLSGQALLGVRIPQKNYNIAIEAYVGGGSGIDVMLQQRLATNHIRFMLGAGVRDGAGAIVVGANYGKWIARVRSFDSESTNITTHSGHHRHHSYSTSTNSTRHRNELFIGYTIPINIS